MASITTVLMSFAVLCQAQTPVDFLEAANAGMSVDSSPHQPSCYVPYALYPRRLCVEIDLHAKCYTDQTKAWDEECAMCRAGRGYLTMEDCTAVRGGNEPAVTPDNNTDEDTPEPEVIKDLERDYFDNETSTRSDFFAHCSKEISEQLKIVTLQQHPGTNCPFKTNGLILWHDQAAWRSRGAEPPQLWSDVEVPSNTKVLITACSLRQDGIYTKIVIPASSEASPACRADAR